MPEVVEKNFQDYRWWTNPSTGPAASSKDQRAAILLGKALFWDQQAGSEDMACATCHYHAGADNRSRNQLRPRHQRAAMLFFDPTGSGGQGINHTLTVDDFPFHKLADPNDRDSVVFFDTDDVVSSAGTFAADFNDIVPGDTIDDCTSVSPDPFGFIIQSVGGPLNTRRVEPRNAPTVINAVFNFRNFWDGRANNVFNGVDSSGFPQQECSSPQGAGGQRRANSGRVREFVAGLPGGGSTVKRFRDVLHRAYLPETGQKAIEPGPCSEC